MLNYSQQEVNPAVEYEKLTEEGDGAIDLSRYSKFFCR